MTKVEKFEAIVDVLNSANADAELIEAMETAIASENRKAERAAERAAEKKAAGDELRAKIESILTNEPMSLDDIVAAIDDPEVTTGKVRSRVSALVDIGKAVKAQMSMEGEDGKKKRVMTYTLA